MQERIIVAPENKIKRRYTGKEERLLHMEKWKQSGLSKSKYCRQEGLSLSSFSNWMRSDSKSKTIFKPIAILPSPDAQTRPNNVIEIILDQRIKIRLLNVTDALLAVNIAKDLIKWN